MILSKQSNGKAEDFESLLSRSQQLLELNAKNNAYNYLSNAATDMEKFIFEAMNKAAKKTPFENTIELVSGFKLSTSRFDTKILRGVKSKTTKQLLEKHGNSVLESTRVDEVERIYLFFCKTISPVQFRFRKYEKCLFDVAVTHSPRYLIDMDLPEGKSIFDKINVPYDELRALKNPIKPIIDYYRKKAKPGEEVWWMETGEESGILLKPTVSLWSNLTNKDQINYRNEAMARFPEVFGKSPDKYQQLASWLAGKHGIVDSSLRDRFSAGGQETLKIGGKTYPKVPKIFLHLQTHLAEIIEIIENLSSEEVYRYWKIKRNLTAPNLLPEWTNLVIKNSSSTLKNSQKVIIHLLGEFLGPQKSSSFLKEEMSRYGINY